MSKNQRAGARQKPKKNVFAYTPVHLAPFAKPKGHGKDEPLKLRPDPELPSEFDAQLQDAYKAWQSTGHAGSILDYICWDWLVHKKKLREHDDFFYQWNGVGRGFPIDFYFQNLNMGWLIESVRFTPRDKAAEGAAKVKMLAKDITTVTLREQDILSRTGLVLDKALQGESLK